MDEAGVRRFVMHYERTTRHMLVELPGRAEVVLHLNRAHQVDRIAVRQPGVTGNLSRRGG
jgi:D-glycerate 3-kinase